MSNIITKEFLKSKGACRDQLEILFAEFSDGGEATLENCLRAAALDIDFDWAANNLLSTTTLKVYREAVAPARKAYDEVMDFTWKDYEDATANAFYQSWLIDHPSTEAAIAAAKENELCHT